jgi:hypothetical protein
VPQHPHLVVCGVRDEPSLFRELLRLEQAGVRCRAFRDPDLDNQLTAVASRPLCGRARRAFRRFRLLRPAGPFASCEPTEED